MYSIYTVHIYIVACFVAIKWMSVCMSSKQPMLPRCVLVPSKPVVGELRSTIGREQTKVDVRVPDLGGWWEELALIHLILLCILNWTCAAFPIPLQPPPPPYSLLWSVWLYLGLAPLGRYTILHRWTSLVLESYLKNPSLIMIPLLT